MMYMSDALKASIDLMESESAAKGICYNLAAWSFSPSQLANLLASHVPNFTISYKIDPVRQVCFISIIYFHFNLQRQLLIPGQTPLTIQKQESHGIGKKIILWIKWLKKCFVF